MKTTIEIPDELFRRTKAKAALEGKSLKEFVAAALRERLARSSPGTDAPSEPAPTCGDDATHIEVGATIDGTLEYDGQFLEDQFFCVDIADGADTVTIALTGMTSDMALFVGYPDLVAVQQGGFNLWSSTTAGLEDEEVTIEPGLTRGQLGGFEENEHVTPGSYYIEVSAGGAADPTPFTLTVRVP